MSETVTIKKEDFELMVDGCKELLELKEKNKPVELDADMFSGLNAMLRKDVKVEKYELEEETEDKEDETYDLSDLTLENNIS